MSEQRLLWWKCTLCGYLFRAPPPPPAKCPDCKETCTFMDVTCYTPECGGPESGNYDPKLAGR